MYWESTLYPRVSLLDKKKDITILLKSEKRDLTPT
jgi:hypothetical protein